MKLKQKLNNSLLFSNYRIINLILASILFAIFSYSAIYSPNKINHPIPSVFTQLTGEISPSTGLSRSFSSLIRCDVKSAINFNPIGLQIFIFFLIQLVFRIGSFFLIKERFTLIKAYILSDITLSTIGFLLVFSPLIKFTFELFKKFIVN
ncbi:DUF2752 domain-containing protein [Marinifilum sp. N1E240]|uniref:DUF2752 domain-containing protein n=1 Tax=Marinifilum sp. N1E240 TaxID=2608082 RepID=UPI00128CAC72|nr:DUF2752 domain-containing protein [Marinifilum sp. N1E240]